MAEEKRDSLYDTLFRISQGDVELFKEETRDFLNVIGQYTDADVEEQNSIMANEVVNDEEVRATTV